MSSLVDRVVWMPGGVRTEVHVTGEQSGGALTVVIDHPPEGWLLPPHLHRHESETIHVIAGHFELEVEGVRRMLGPGDTLFIPAGAVHSGRLLGGVGHRLVTFTPGGIDRFFLEVGTHHAGSSVDAGRVLHAAAHYGWEFPGELQHGTGR